ncbi:MAG: pirin family protein [Bdellovibrionales bacterium]|nr:pirin family protein [Bdellovibrionales bacterium]
MILIRQSQDRGHFNFGWLDTFHSFSFGDYRDPEHMGFRNLRVINEDKIQPAKGFGTHPHKNMEIITYVTKGELAHKDSMGNGSSILPGEVQYMSAGSGVTHSEFNKSKEETTHLLQIWIIPDREDTDPRYNQKSISKAQKKNRLYRIVGPDGSNAPIEIYQDVTVYASILDVDVETFHTFESNRYGWLQVVSGSLICNGKTLRAGDGASISDERDVKFKATIETEFLLFDLN